MAGEQSRKIGIEVVAENNTAEGFQGVEAGAAAMAAGVSRAGDKVSQSLSRMGDGGEAAARKVDRDAKTLISRIQRISAATEAGGQDTSKYFELISKQKSIPPDMLRPYIDQLRAVEVAQKSAAASMAGMGQTAGQTRQALQQLPMQFQDIVVSLQAGQAPMTVMLQQGSQLAGSFGGIAAAAKAMSSYLLGLVTPFTAIGAAVVTLGVAYYQGASESDKFSKSLILSGNSAGTTTSALREMAREMAGISGTQSGAVVALATMAEFSQVGADKLREYTSAAVQWEKATGQAVSETAKQFAELGKDPLQAALKLNEGTNYLTESVYKQIRALEQQGKSAEASALSQQAWADALTGRSKQIQDNLGYIERAWNSVKDAAKNSWDAMLGVGRKSTLGDQLDSAKKQLADRQAKSGVVGDDAAWQAGNKRLQDRIDHLKGLISEEERAATATAAGGEQVKARAKWDEDGNKFLSKSVQMERELAVARNEAVEAGASAVELEKRLSDIREKYKEKGAGRSVGAQENAVAAIKARIKEEETLIARIKEYGSAAEKITPAEKMVRELREQIAESTNKATIAEKTRLLALAESWQATEKERIALDASAKAKAKQDEANQKQIDSMYKSADATQEEAEKIKASIAVYGKARAEIERMTLAKLQQKAAEMEGLASPAAMEAINAQIAAQKELVAGVEAMDFKKFQDSVVKSLEASKAELAIQQEGLSLIGLSDTARQKVIASRKIELDVAKKIAEVDKTTFSGDEAEDLRQREGLKQKIREQGEIDTQVAIGKIQEQYVSEQVRQYDEVFRRGFADMLNNGKDGWKSFTKSLVTTFKTTVADQIYKMFAQPFVVQLVGSFAGLLGGAAGLMGSSGNSGSSSGGGASGLLSAASGANSLYGLFTGSTMSTLGSWATSLGTTMGSNWLTGMGMSMSGYTMPATMVGPGAGVGMSGTSGMAAAWPLAVIAGMFMSNKLFSAGLSANTYSGAQRATDPGNYLGTRILSPILGERTANILTGAPVAKYVFDSLFGRKLKDAGVEGTVGGERGFEGQKFEYYKGGLFRSNKTKYSELEEVNRSELADMFTGVKDGVTDMAKAIGLSVDGLASFTSKLKISMMGLTDAEINTKIAEEFKRIADEMAAVVLVSDEYAKGEETRAETLSRLGTRMVAVNQWLDVMGDKLLEVSLVGADMASSLIDAFGDDDAFATATSNYVSKYFSQVEQLDLVNKQIGESLKTLGIDSVPQTREALKELINAQDLTTDSGRKAYAALLSLAGVLDTVYSAADQAKELGRTMDIELLRATGNEDGAVQLEREKQLADLALYGDEVSKSLIEKQKQIWAAQDAEAGKQAAEAQKQAALSAAGLSVDALVGGFMEQVNSGRGAQAGVWLADTIAAGFEQAIYGQALGVIMNSIIDGVVTPVVTAAMTGSTVSAAISGAAIDTMVANATAAAAALATLMNDPAFKEAMEKTLDVLKDLGNSIGSTIPKMSTYKAAQTSVATSYDYTTSAAESAADAAKKLADQWKSTVDSMSDEMKRLRGELLGESDDQGMAYYESLFAIKTAQARAGDQDAADELPSIIQALEALAKGSAGSKSEVLLMQSAWLDSLGYTRDFLASKYGVDIGNEQASVTGATTAATVIKGSANTAVLGALQSSSDNPALAAELRALRTEVELLRKDQRAISDVETPALQDIAKSTKRTQMITEFGTEANA